MQGNRTAGTNHVAGELSNSFIFKWYTRVAPIMNAMTINSRTICAIGQQVQTMSPEN
jgi:hypothetical protein